MSEWKISDRLTQPAVSQYIRWLGAVSAQKNSRVFYDARSCWLLDELFALLGQVKPISKNGVRSLWLRARRGTIDDFAAQYGSFESFSKDGSIGSYARYKAYWQELFPDEVGWYNLSAVGGKVTHYRTVFLHHCQIVEQNGQMSDDVDPLDISDIVEWFVESVRYCVEALREGTYNTIVARELPAKHRAGTILRKDYWALYPKERAMCVEGLAQDEVDAFLACAVEGSDAVGRLPQMTANDFFRFCAMGYQANGCEGAELTPREQYLKYADGRHGGLADIAPDSPEEFEKWLDSMEWVGTHPWEVCRGGGLTHISLYVMRDERGYSMCLAGASIWCFVESVRFFLALYRAGIPVVHREAELLKERLKGTEKVGVVPHGIVPLYCQSLFPNEKVEDFVQLPDVEEEKMAALCKWQPVPPVKLA